MANLVDVDLKEECASYMDDLFDTFARTLQFIVYKNPEEVIVSLDSNFNADWDQKKPWLDPNSTYTQVSQSFPARIWYLDYEQQMNSLYLEGKILEGSRFKREIQSIKIQVREDAYLFIKDANKCEFNNYLWNVKTSEKQVGIFDFNFYTFMLERAD